MENNKAAIPGAIIIAGILIAGAVYLRGSPATPTGASGLAQVASGPTAAEKQELLKKVRPVDSRDHIRGNPNAPVKIIEYSDLECPFCKQFHNTMLEIMKQYEGKVAWVYRHFPLETLHPVKAQAEAEAAECATTLGDAEGWGSKAFWDYIDLVFANTPSNNGLDPALLTKFATDIGLDKKAFENCLSGGYSKARVTTDADNAVEAGGQGTPFSLIMSPDGTLAELGGAAPLPLLKTQIDARLK